jgi:hypothetical protein
VLNKGERDRTDVHRELRVHWDFRTRLAAERGPRFPYRFRCAVFANTSGGEWQRESGPNGLEGGLEIVDYSVQTVVVGRRQSVCPLQKRIG